MAIDKEPKVGRILLKTAIPRNAPFGRAGKITKINGARIYYKDKNGDKRYIQQKTLTAVCDTEKEESALLDFSNKSWRVVAELEKKIQEQAKAFFFCK